MLKGEGEGVSVGDGEDWAKCKAGKARKDVHERVDEGRSEHFIEVVSGRQRLEEKVEGRKK